LGKSALDAVERVRDAGKRTADPEKRRFGFKNEDLGRSNEHFGSGSERSSNCDNSYRNGYVLNSHACPSEITDAKRPPLEISFLPESPTLPSIAK
jgi:hypothetical protein